MKRGIWGAATLALLLALLTVAQASATTNAQNVTVQWHSTAIVKFTLTPNYYTGYGAVKAVFGTQPAPVAGPGAPAAVDFGGVIAGDTYLYKYAAHLHVTTNDSTGFYVYGEGAANFVDSNSAATSNQSFSLSQTLYYLTSGATSDSNTGFSPGLPFSVTSGIVSGGGDSTGTPPTITYSSYPSPIATSSTANNDYYYDYQLKVPAAANSGDQYFVWVVYTVVAR